MLRLIVIFMTLFATACRLPFPEGDLATGSVTLESLAYADLPYTGYPLLDTLNPPVPTDESGVPIYVYGGKSYRNPVQISQLALQYLDNYRQTADSDYLEHARRNAEALIKISEKRDGALLLPYEFRFPLHDGFGGDTMIPPWYSGMAQGRAVSVMVRMYWSTGDHSWLEAAREFADSFVLLQGRSHPWVVSFDDLGRFWINEYPQGFNTFTLNGHIYALFGLYDLWLTEHDTLIGELARAAVFTVRETISEFRVPGGVSLYCLKHRVQSEKYHRIHVSQLMQLAKMTGDSFFLDRANELKADFY
jgi:hypothetical protein